MKNCLQVKVRKSSYQRLQRENASSPEKKLCCQGRCRGLEFMLRGASGGLNASGYSKQCCQSASLRSTRMLT